MQQPVVTKSDIVAGLRSLGLKAGDKVIAHSALSAFGRVKGGADAVIDALLEVLGEEGTLLMPTMGGGQPFDIRTTPSRVGAVTETFRKRPGVLRSLHPSHSVCAYGKDAAWFVAGHERAPTAYNEGTPYRRILDFGKILLLGVDQDRNTCLHAIEAMAGAPYLRTIQRDYIDRDGRVKTMTIEQMAGPHRDFIGLDRRFREAGVMTIGKIGAAVCRLMDGPGVVRVGLEAFREDPAAVLCDNPYCLDCRRQRGAIKADRLKREDFTLSAVSDEAAPDLDDALEFISHEGASAVELRQVGGVDVHLLSDAELDAIKAQLDERGFAASAVSACSPAPDAAAMLRAARRLAAPAIVLPFGDLPDDVLAEAQKRGIAILLENRGESGEEVLETLARWPRGAMSLAFNPAGFAAAGEKPFLKTYRTPLKHRIGQLYIADGLWDGTPRLPGQGNGEVKEVISILRCRSFPGCVTLKSGLAGDRDSFRETGDAFWRLMDSM